MTDFLKQPDKFQKIEFWAATTIFIFSVFFLITTPFGSELSQVYTPNKAYFEQANIEFSFYQNYFFPQLSKNILLYLAFLLLNFEVVPQLMRKKGRAINIGLIILVFLVMGVAFGIADTHAKNYVFTRFESVEETYMYLFQNSFLFSIWLLLMFGFYSIIKYISIYILANSRSLQSRYRFVTSAGLNILVVWLVILFLLLVGEAELLVILGWSMFVPTGVLLYWYSFYSLIPRCLRAKRPLLRYLLNVLLLGTLAFLPVALIFSTFTSYDEPAFALSLMNSLFHLCITPPFIWAMFKRHLKGNEEIYFLKKELGQSHASLDFLKSQINPHFLFNALNTIYGTALQENAERTGEGIEKLGNMMRFMLHENLQEKISLNREIEYLENYIGLQKLRTDANPDVRISAVIQLQENLLQISPMLLIPFVENAFKHGISFRQPSHININLETRENTLYFDVYNSKHFRVENDPEKDKSGIGLNNVKQRLQLLYPGRHELNIRETGKEYFIHLTIQLS